MCLRKGRTKAVSAVARKLAVILWNMIVKKMPYKTPTDYMFLDEKRILKLVARVKKEITKFDLTKEDFVFANA